MKKTLKSILAVLVALTLVLGVVGCGGNDESKVSFDKGTGEIPTNIRAYAPLPAALSAVGIRDYNDILTFKAMEELTGCHVDWTHPAQGTGGEKFNLMLVSGDLPDLIVSSWCLNGQTGESYAEDGILIPLSELIEENMPNLSKLLKERPDVKKQFTEENGEIYYIPVMAPEDEMKVARGPVIREDWLKKLGLEVPSTPEELYEVLKAFKTGDPNGNGKADEIPMGGVKYNDAAYGIDRLIWMYGAHHGIYLKDGKPAYGVMEEEYEEGLKYIVKLYKEGLIDQDFLLDDKSKMDSKIMNDRTGFYFGYQPTKMQRSMDDGTRKLIGIPVLAKEGVKNNIYDSTRNVDVANISVAVTTQCKNPSGTLKWLDNFFGGEGLMLYNFGVEGESYDMVNGEPVFKPEVLADGNYSHAIAANTSTWPGVRQWDYYKQILLSWGRDAIETWSKSTGIDGMLPPHLSFTTEERDALTQIYAQIETYVDEKVNKIAIGQLSIDELPKIREQVKKMGIDQILDIYEAALKRYNSR